MAIPYRIQKQIFQNKEIFIGQFKPRSIFSYKMFIERIFEAPASVSRETYYVVLEVLKKTIMALCLDGYKIALNGFIHFEPRIGGTFVNSLSSFQPGKNRIYINAYISKTFNADFENQAMPEKIR